MNELIGYTYGSQDLEWYCQQFLTLLKYAPPRMNQEVKVAQFITGLNPPLNTWLQSQRFTTFANVFEARKPIDM